MPTRLVLSGATGRMGRVVADLAAAATDLAIVGGLDREPYDRLNFPVQAPEDAAPLLRDADVVVDFSAPQLLMRLLSAQGEALAGRALVVGTTGLGPDVEAALDVQARRSALLVAANFSVGVNLLLALAEQAAAVLDAEHYDAEIVEAHHRRKVDAPSGTALALLRALARGRGVDAQAVRRDGRSGQVGARPRAEIGVHALRGGDVVGEHRVLFLGERERIELAHAATDRALFADGALAAVRWIAGKPPGRYEMRDVLGLR